MFLKASILNEKSFYSGLLFEKARVLLHACHYGPYSGKGDYLMLLAHVYFSGFLGYTAICSLIWKRSYLFSSENGTVYDLAYLPINYFFLLQSCNLNHNSELWISTEGSLEEKKNIVERRLYTFKKINCNPSLIEIKDYILYLAEKKK